MREKLEKALLWFMTAVMPVFIAACYGPGMEGPVPLPDSDNLDTDVAITGSVRDSAGAPIGGILVTCLRGATEVDSTYTLAGDGSFNMDISGSQSCLSLRFEDVDGAENGGAFAQAVLNYDGEPVNVSLNLE